MKRYIDDGIGIHTMTKRRFEVWKTAISGRVAEFGMKIKRSDWSTPSSESEMINFLDINFTFDKNNVLQTDLYKKPTDARNYLNFSSCHPQYTFSSVVYSQALRLRRIINDDSRFKVRLSELGRDFEKCNYPVKMIQNILQKVAATKRCLEKRNKDPSATDDKLLVISTYGRDRQLTNVMQDLEKNCEKLSFRYVKKTAPSLRNILTKSKNTALGPPFGNTVPCDRRRCQSCPLMSGKDNIPKFKNSKKCISTAGGNCLSRMLIYHAECKLCKKVYVGKTVQHLVERINGHRNKFYACLRGDFCEDKNNDDDAILLGLHLLLFHNLQYKRAFNETYAFTILEHCSPDNIDLNEHLWIHRLKCIKPFGLNSHDPLGIPLVL